MAAVFFRLASDREGPARAASRPHSAVDREQNLLLEEEVLLAAAPVFLPAAEVGGSGCP